MYFKDKEVFKYIIEAIKKSTQIISVRLEEFVQIEHSHVTTQKQLPVSTNSRAPPTLHYSFDLQQAWFLDFLWKESYTVCILLCPASFAQYYISEINPHCCM